MSLKPYCSWSSGKLSRQFFPLQTFHITSNVFGTRHVHDWRCSLLCEVFAFPCAIKRKHPWGNQWRWGWRQNVKNLNIITRYKRLKLLLLLFWVSVAWVQNLKLEFIFPNWKKGKKQELLKKQLHFKIENAWKFKQILKKKTNNKHVFFVFGTQLQVVFYYIFKFCKKYSYFNLFGEDSSTRLAVTNSKPTASRWKLSLSEFSLFAQFLLKCPERSHYTHQNTTNLTKNKAWEIYFFDEWHRNVSLIYSLF